MDCSQTRELMDLALDGALSPHQQAEFEEHLRKCEECQMEYLEIKALMDAIRNLPEIEVPEGFRESWQQAIREEKPETEKGKLLSFLRARPLMILTAAAAAVFIGVMGPQVTAPDLFTGGAASDSIAPESAMSDVSGDAAAEPEGGMGILAMREAPEAPAALEAPADAPADAPAVAQDQPAEEAPEVLREPGQLKEESEEPRMGIASVDRGAFLVLDASLEEIRGDLEQYFMDSQLSWSSQEDGYLVTLTPEQLLGLQEWLKIRQVPWEAEDRQTAPDGEELRIGFTN